MRNEYAESETGTARQRKTNLFFHHDAIAMTELWVKLAAVADRQYVVVRMFV